MNFKYLLFDLDGTLTDPKEGITKSVAHALDCYGISVADLDELIPFIGPPLSASFKNYGFTSKEDIEAVVAKYREYFAPKGIYENAVYDGIPEMLEALKARGKKLYVATSKPEPFAVKILDHFGLSKYFDFIGGCTLDFKRNSKAEVVKYVLETNSIPTAETAMIGDKEHDIIGGKENGLYTVGVRWGYSAKGELEAAKADFIADTVEALIEKFI